MITGIRVPFPACNPRPIKTSSSTGVIASANKIDGNANWSVGSFQCSRDFAVAGGLAVRGAGTGLDRGVSGLAQ
jgi:hypothetical protein